MPTITITIVVAIISPVRCLGLRAAPPWALGSIDLATSRHDLTTSRRFLTQHLPPRSHPASSGFTMQWHQTLQRITTATPNVHPNDGDSCQRTLATGLRRVSPTLSPIEIFFFDSVLCKDGSALGLGLSPPWTEEGKEC